MPTLISIRAKQPFYAWRSALFIGLKFKYQLFCNWFWLI